MLSPHPPTPCSCYTVELNWVKGGGGGGGERRREGGEEEDENQFIPGEIGC